MRERIVLHLCAMFVALCIGLALPESVRAEEIDAPDYERDYVQELYDSSKGLDGSSVNCVFADKNGMIWLGCYSGLYSYDSTEFHQYKIADHTVGVRCIAQDSQGRLWLGTNGDGIFCYEDGKIYSLPCNGDGNLCKTVYDISVDENGCLWAASGAGLLRAWIKEEDAEAVLMESVGTAPLRNLDLWANGNVICVSRSGVVTNYQNGKSRVITPKGIPEGERARSIDVIDRKHIYVGTNGDTILEIDPDGNVLQTIHSEKLSSFNKIYPITDTSAWVCADNGIGLLQGDTLTKVDLGMDNSVETVCVDYQGNYWFASSRVGLLHLYENYFANMGSYLDISKVVNSVIIYQKNLYIGTDEGLFCYKGKESLTPELVERCEGVRVRQLLVDENENLWVATTRRGLFRQTKEGEVEEFTSNNSGLSTNDLRCLLAGGQGELYIGSENGIYVLDQNDEIHRVVNHDGSILGKDRILCMEESDGRLFVGMDGDGIYMVQNGEVIGHKSMDDGLFSNVILKIRKDEEGEGLWVVSGSGICHISKEGMIQHVIGIPLANSLDLIHVGDGDVVLLARNGFFRLKEKDLLKNSPGYQFYNRERGFIVDATSNASHCVENHVLYICGMNGLATLDLNRSSIQRDLRTYISAVKADDTEVLETDGTYVLGEDAYRVNIDIRLLNYCHDAWNVSYYLDGMDHKETIEDAEDFAAVSYTNLRGKTYHYRFKVINADTGEVMDEKSIKIEKEKHFWENTNNQIMLGIVLIISIIGFIYVILQWRGKRMEQEIRNKVMQEKQKEIERAAYTDLVTGVYNRNIYELDKERYPVDCIKGLATVGINNAEYLRKRNGAILVEDLLRDLVSVLRSYLGDEVRIYRISDYVFCIPFHENIDLEEFTQVIKHDFDNSLRNRGEEITGLSVGAVYVDPYMKDTYKSLFDRCDRMRRLDQEHEESRFIHNKIVMVENAIAQEEEKEREKREKLRKKRKHRRGRK